MRPEYAWKYIETFIFIGKANFIRAALNFVGIQPKYDKCDCAILTLIIMVALELNSIFSSKYYTDSYIVVHARQH
jgi:hypothetical protein